jgi:hypothetical protein
VWALRRRIILLSDSFLTIAISNFLIPCLLSLASHCCSDLKKIILVVEEPDAPQFSLSTLDSELGQRPSSSPFQHQRRIAPSKL